MVWVTSTCPLVPDWKSLFPEASLDFPVWVRGFLGCLKPAPPPTPHHSCPAVDLAAFPSRLCSWEGQTVATCPWWGLRASIHQVLNKCLLSRACVQVSAGQVGWLSLKLEQLLHGLGQGSIWTCLCWCHRAQAAPTPSYGSLLARSCPSPGEGGVQAVIELVGGRAYTLAFSQSHPGEPRERTMVTGYRKLNTGHPHLAKGTEAPRAGGWPPGPGSLLAWNLGKPAAPRCLCLCPSPASGERLPGFLRGLRHSSPTVPLR